MKQYGFDFKTISGYNCFRITVDQLKSVASKRKWLHDLNKDFADEDDELIEIDSDDSDKAVDMTVEYKKLLAKYNALLKLQKSDSDSDSDSEDEEPIAKKTPAKTPRQHLSTKENRRVCKWIRHMELVVSQMFVNCVQIVCIKFMCLTISVHLWILFFNFI
jgi:hypothetical protein